MREPDFIIGQGDTNEDLTVTIKDSRGTPVNLSGKTVQFQMRSVAGTVLVVNAAATPDADQNGHTGECTYSWASNDTATAGDYYGDFKVTDAGGANPTTYPNDDRRKLLIRISERLV